MRKTACAATEWCPSTHAHYTAASCTPTKYFHIIKRLDPFPCARTKCHIHVRAQTHAHTHTRILIARRDRKERKKTGLTILFPRDKPLIELVVFGHVLTRLPAFCFESLSPPRDRRRFLPQRNVGFIGGHEPLKLQK